MAARSTVNLALLCNPLLGTPAGITIIARHFFPPGWQGSRLDCSLPFHWNRQTNLAEKRSSVIRRLSPSRLAQIRYWFNCIRLRVACLKISRIVCRSSEGQQFSAFISKKRNYGAGCSDNRISCPERRQSKQITQARNQESRC
jgi:hypothetical protein